MIKSIRKRKAKCKREKRGKNLIYYRKTAITLLNHTKAYKNMTDTIILLKTKVKSSKNQHHCQNWLEYRQLNKK